MARRSRSANEDGVSLVPNKGGRPPKLSPDLATLTLLEGMGQIQCTTKEAACVLKVSEPTFLKLLSDHPEARAAFEMGKGQGHHSLRRTQFKLAEKNASMAIFLGKKGGGSSSWLSAAFKMGRSFFGFSGGGYTGDGGVLEPAGIVHKGEFVLPQHAVSRIGLPKLEAMRLGALPGFSAGGLVGGGPIPGAAPRQSGPVVFDMRGAFVPEAFMREVEQKVSAGEARMRGEVPGLAVSAVRDAQDRYAF